MNLIDLLRSRATEADNRLTEQRHTIDAPLIHRYPFGCCEIVSTHWGLALQTEFPIFSIQIAQAYDRDNNEWHYWVELENIVLDLTAHQFDQYDAPLVVYIPSPLEKRFPDVKRFAPCEAEENANFPISQQLLGLLRYKHGHALGFLSPFGSDMLHMG